MGAGAIPLPRPRPPDPVWVPAPEPPPPSLDAGRMVSAVLEVLDGRRSSRLLREVAVPGLVRRLEVGVRVRSTRLVSAPRVCHPSRFVGEIAAVIRRERRFLAAAARVEHRDGRWWFTAFSVLE